MSITTATLQTPPGRGGIAVIQLTGPAREQILAQIFRPSGTQPASCEGQLELGYLTDAHRRIDQVIVCRRGDAAEINIHGGPQVARAVMTALRSCGAVVGPPAEIASESFALAHDKWNNPAIGAELLECLPSAQSPLVAAALSQQWSGGISSLAAAVLDLGDRAGRAHADSLSEAADGLGVMSRLLKPAEVVLAGRPNVGKSTLANALAGTQMSIVHTTAGTTRDWVRELALLDGVPIYLTDTAGLWDSSDDLDAEAVRRAHQRACQADLVVLMGAGGRAELPDWWRSDNVLHVASKCDTARPSGEVDVSISAVTGEGMGQLRQCLRQALGLDAIDPRASRAFTRRQADILSASADALREDDYVAASKQLENLLTG